MRLRSSLLLLIGTAWLAACTPELNWREVRPEGAGLLLLFPCKVHTETRAVPLAGATVPMTMTGCETAGSTFALAHADLGDARRAEAALGELRSSLASKLPVPPQPVPWALPASSPGAGRWHTDARLPDGHSLRQDALFFAHGTRVYQVAARGERLSAEAADTFFESIQLRAP